MQRTQMVWIAIFMTAASPTFAQLDQARDLYLAYGCYQCHGYSGQGGAAGPQLAPAPLPFEAFAEIVRRPPNRMPAYSPNGLSDSDLELIYHYVSSIERPPALDDIPLLSGPDLD